MKTRASVLVVAVLVVGCGGGGKSKPQPVSGPAKQVATVIARLQKATARKDFTTICDKLLAAATRRQAGGAQCPAVLGARARGVRRPRIVIKAIELQGDSARVTVRTTAGDQTPATDVIRLVREKGHYRVLALGS